MNHCTEALLRVHQIWFSCHLSVRLAPSARLVFLNHLLARVLSAVNIRYQTLPHVLHL